MEIKREIESSGSDVAAAIAVGLAELGVSKDQVDVHVIEEGSRGLLGIGARPARVRLAVKANVEPEPLPESQYRTLAAPATPTLEEITVTETVPPPSPEPEPAPGIADEETPQNHLKRVAPAARQTLEELLEKMGVEAQVEDFVQSAQDPDDYPKLVLNVVGRDLGALIGRRGETLTALQFLTRLIVGREVERRVNLVVDVEGYRERRERSLRQLAQRMADRVVATGRRQVLEPMSAAERRVIHVALRNHPDVATESVGHGENRKVTIFLRGTQ